MSKAPLEQYLQTCQNDAAALQRLADTLCHFVERPADWERALVIELAQAAFMLASGLNEALDSINLPEGVLK
ncbi:hypothetical protein JJJ17_07160 [Paracoccus caeni]|uniref:Uncharacterized protein n=1 Tax=Paracoccus caeni TaxID=657651 RepID=A0A934SJR3_9RHOB|nr:hypothetical protein [Paracoccus caeni]MBK4215698.1 hypothetical protein [Paracoccus caeni]